MTSTGCSDQSSQPSGEAEVCAVIRISLAAVFEKWAEKLVAVYLFGSSASGHLGPMSDVDLAVLFKDQYYAAAAELKIDFYLDCSRALKRNDIDIVVLNTAKNVFLMHEIISTGIVLFDKEPDDRKEFEVWKEHHFIDYQQRRKRVMGD